MKTVVDSYSRKKLQYFCIYKKSAKEQIRFIASLPRNSNLIRQ